MSVSNGSNDFFLERQRAVERMRETANRSRYTPPQRSAPPPATQKPQRQMQQKIQKEPKVSKFDPDGKKCRLSGWITGGVGVSCMLVGAILVGIGGEEYITTYPSGNTVYYFDDTLPITGSALLTVGAGATAVSIPLLVVGITRKYKSTNLSAESAQSYILELQAQKNQIGLALKF